MEVNVYMERTQIYLDSQHKRILKHMAVDRDTSMSNLIRAAITIYIINESGSNKKYITKEFNKSLFDKENKNDHLEISN